MGGEHRALSPTPYLIILTLGPVCVGHNQPRHYPLTPYEHHGVIVVVSFVVDRWWLMFIITGTVIVVVVVVVVVVHITDAAKRKEKWEIVITL